MTKVTAYKEQLIEQLGPLQGITVLDYGCGRGEFIELLLPSGASMIYAVDSSLDAINHIK